MKFTVRKTILSVAFFSLQILIVPGSVSAGSEPFIGEINYVGFNYAPRNWAMCDGQLLPISENSTLFALLGTTYGGDGRTSFALPDMRGRVPIHQGKGPGLNNYRIGQKNGTETKTLTLTNMAEHNHAASATSMSTSTVASGASATSTLNVSSVSGDSVASGNYLAGLVGRQKMYTSTTPDVNLNAGSISTTLSGVNINTTTNTTVTVSNNGTGQAFSIIQPYTVVNCIIALQGIFPPRN